MKKREPEQKQEQKVLTKSTCESKRIESNENLNGCIKPKKKNVRKGFAIYFLKSSILILSIMVFMLLGKVIDDIKFDTKKQTEIETIKYVEESKTPMSNFIIFLNNDLDPAIAGIIAESIDKASKKHKLPRKLIAALIRTESNYDVFAKSHAGAIGLMQVMPKIHKDKLNGRNPFFVDSNIDVGCQILKEYLDIEKGNLDRALHRYLSKNATKEQLDKYCAKIYGFWAKSEMYDYLSTQEKEENKENVNGSMTHSEQTELQLAEPDHHPQS